MTQKNFIQNSRYRILGLVGRGQFGRVFCARNRKTGNLFALKELEVQRFPTSSFLRELRFLLSLQHKNIVTCSALEHSKNVRYLVMEYCEAGTLRDLLGRGGGLHLAQAIQIVIDILEGLEHAHHSNIIHCDIKPENVLLKLTQTGWQAKVSDFGIARLSQENDKFGNTGSPGYMAPERFYGQFSVASDLYAVGVILYEVLLNQRPFSGQPSELMIAHINHRVKMPENVPPQLQAIVLKSLEKLPGRRYTSASQMRSQLVALTGVLDLDRVHIHQPSRDDEEQEEKLKHLQPIYIRDFMAEQEVGLQLVAIARGSNTSLITATKAQLQQQQLPSASQALSLSDAKIIAEFKDQIVAVRTVEDKIFAITQHSIQYLSNGKRQILYQSLPRFSWTVSPDAKWIAVASKQSLEIRNLAFGKTCKIDLPDRNIDAITAIDQHHLVAITHKPDSKDSRILVISRRGNILWKFFLPTTISLAVSSFTANRLLIAEALNPNYLLLIDLKPYRVSRLEIDYQPYQITATKWGYVVVAMQDQHTSSLHLLDAHGQLVGHLLVEGRVNAIAALDAHLLALSTDQGESGKLYLIDLTKLDIDLIF